MLVCHVEGLLLGEVQAGGGNQSDARGSKWLWERGKGSGVVHYKVRPLGVQVKKRGDLGVDLSEGLIFEFLKGAHGANQCMNIFALGQD